VKSCASIGEANVYRSGWPVESTRGSASASIVNPTCVMSDPVSGCSSLLVSELTGIPIASAWW